MPYRLPTRVLAPIVLAAALTTSVRAQPPGRLADQYGFLPLEIYKLEDRISNLLAADLDGDKAADLAVANNARSRIDLLLTSPGPDEADQTRKEPNELRSDRRMRLVTVPVNREVVSLKAGDFDGDGQLDLAFYGLPAEVQILRNEGGGRFSAPRRYETGQAIESGSSLAVADLDGNGRTDLALLTATEVLAFLQDDSGQLKPPERWPHTATRPRLIWYRDMNGDGRTDQIIGDDDEAAPVRIRFREPSGRLGAEERFAMEDPRAFDLADLDGVAGSELLTIEDRSGRVQWLRLEANPPPEAGDAMGLKGRAQLFPLGARDTRARALDHGDLDGDGRTDVVATDPSRAQVLVFRQGEEGLQAAQAFPSLSGTKGVQVADLDGDSRAEVLVLSGAEKQLGVSSLDDKGLLPFPTPLPVAAEPLVFAVGNLDADPAPEIVYAVATGDQPPYAVRALQRRADGSYGPYAWAGTTEVTPLTGLTSAPTAIRIVDANVDSLADILVFRGSGNPVLLLGRKDQEPEPFTGSPGPLAGAESAAVSVPPDGQGLIVAAGTYARAVRLDAEGRWEVRDSFNSGQANASVLGAAKLPADDGKDGTDRVALWNRSNRSVLWLEPREGIYRPAGRVEVGPIDFIGLHVAHLDSDEHPDLLVAGTDRFAAVLTGKTGSRFVSVASYGPARRDAYLGDLIAGDLNGDSRPDILTLDTGKNFVDILAATPSPTPTLESALAFPIFETKSFSARDQRVEPREAALGDFNGDGLTDFALIIHDRILIYRQDSGSTPDVAKPSADAQPADQGKPGPS